MTISIKHEMLVFWSIFLCGQLICIIFDFFRSLRKNTSPSKMRVAIEDIVFCIAAFKIFFDTLYITNNGHMRWYIPASLISSGVIYFCAESKYIMKIWGFLFKILNFLLSPLFKIFRFFKKMIVWAAKAAKTRISTAFRGIFAKFGQIAAKKPHKPHENKDLI